MPIFVVERRFAERLELSAEDAAEVNRINADDDVRWVSSFLSADKRKTFCLYEAPDMDAIRRAAHRAGLPVDAIEELSGQVTPDGAFAPM